jgi:transposase
MKHCLNLNSAACVNRCQNDPEEVDSSHRSTASSAANTFANWIKTLRPNLAVEVVKRSDDVRYFKVLPWRWVVERTFGWLICHRRLVREYERTISSAEACVYIAMIRIQLCRLARFIIHVDLYNSLLKLSVVAWTGENL